MTLVDKVISENSEAIRNFIMLNSCPNDWSKDLINYDDASLEFNEEESGRAIGCRGISCKECWMQEAGDGNDED